MNKFISTVLFLNLLVIGVRGGGAGGAAAPPKKFKAEKLGKFWA